MERHEILEMMGELKLAGMRAAFDEVLANGVKRQHAAQQIVGDLLAAEIAESRRARSATRWPRPSCPWPRSWPTSTSPAA
jgi:hypothetical protein